MRKPTRPREVGRGERVVPGVWRLRLPLPLPGVPHANAWALQAGDGIVLVDCGMDVRSGMVDLERALDQAGWTFNDVTLLLITHAHIDHCGQAPKVAERAGCEVWMHPAWRSHALPPTGRDAERVLAQKVEAARHSGVPEAPLQAWAERTLAQGTGQAPGLASDRDLTEGLEVLTDHAIWRVLETPGHAPSHVCLHDAERRLLISGDHLLGRVSQYFDVDGGGDPVGDFLASLDRTDGLGARLGLAGHGRPFNDLPGHVAANRVLVAERLTAVREALAAAQDSTAYAVARTVYGDEFTDASAAWLMTMTVAWLRHLRALGEAATDGEPARWRLT